jgi:hypothetical protein
MKPEPIRETNQPERHLEFLVRGALHLNGQ